MESTPGDGREERPHQPVTLPGALAAGATMLVVGAFDPAAHAVCLRLLGRYGGREDTAYVVATGESADETIATWERISSAGDRPAIGLVDTTSEEQSLAATFGDVPTVYTPSSGDLERIVMGLSELSGTTRPIGGSRHLVFRSLTPVLEESSATRVCRVIERIDGLRTGAGLGVFGVDVAAHDRPTLTKLADAVDGVVWVDRTNDGRFECDFHPKRRHVSF